MAMINGTTVAVGDAIEGFRILEIRPDLVMLTDGSTTYRLQLLP